MKTIKVTSRLPEDITPQAAHAASEFGYTDRPARPTRAARLISWLPSAALILGMTLVAWLLSIT